MNNKSDNLYRSLTIEKLIEIGQETSSLASRISVILDDTSNEIHMWRKRFLDSYDLTDEEKPYVEDYFFASPPCDLKDPVDYIEQIRAWVKEDHL